MKYFDHWYNPCGHKEHLKTYVEANSKKLCFSGTNYLRLFLYLK